MRKVSGGKLSGRGGGGEGEGKGWDDGRGGEEVTFTISLFLYDVNVAAGGRLG